MGYEHTQRGKMHWLLLAAAAICVVGAIFTPQRTPQWAGWMLLFGAGMSMALFFSFQTLAVRDDGDALLLRYGPWPVWKKRIPYASITDPRVSRSKFVDGWGIHWFPGRGWTWNLWTFACVEMQVNGKPFRIGSDDSEALAAFLQSRVEAAS